MKQISNLLKKHDLKANSYRKLGKTTLIDTNDGKVIIKEKNRNQDKIYNYLNSRSFRYYPEIIFEDDKFFVTRYIDGIDMPLEQKMLDMIDLVSLLHNKTTHYKEIDLDDYKKIYEDISNNIDYLNSYYNDIISVIETKVYMGPDEYLLARNISKILSSINYCSNELQNWYELINQKRKQRFVVLHNNLDVNHFIRDTNSYLISWDKAKIDLPIFDLYKLYKKSCLDYDFESILKRYESNYPLLQEERLLLFILISLPDKIEFDNNIYENTKAISKQIDVLYKTENLLSSYYLEKKEKNTKDK